VQLGDVAHVDNAEIDPRAAAMAPLIRRSTSRIEVE